MTLATAAIGVFEALLFRMLGHLVDWLATVDRTHLFANERQTMTVFACIMLASIPLVGYQSLVRRQGLAGNFAMRLRWDFHRRMLAQSLAFYQDEFAGRVATKVMQTALAVRDAWFIVTDILVYIALYFATVLWVVGVGLAGYWFGNIPWVKVHLEKIIWGLILVPGCLALFGAWRAGRSTSTRPAD